MIFTGSKLSSNDCNRQTPSFYLTALHDFTTFLMLTFNIARRSSAHDRTRGAILLCIELAPVQEDEDEEAITDLAWCVRRASR